jgi:hypothetical protein
MMKQSFNYHIGNIKDGLGNVDNIEEIIQNVNDVLNQGVGAAMATDWAMANHDPVATAPPYTDD